MAPDARNRQAERDRVEGSGSGVEATQVCRRNAPIEDIPQELVAEIDDPVVPVPIQVRALDELLQRLVQVADRAIHDPGQDLRDEAAADDSAGAGDLAGLRRELAEPGEDRVLDRLRNVGIPDLPAIRSRVVAERAEQLLDVEREPVRSLVDGRHDLAGRRQACVEDQRRHQRGLVVRQRRQARLLGKPLGDQPGPPLAEERARRQLLGPVGADEQHRQLARPTRQLADDLEADLVGPLEVLEVEHHGPVDRGQDPVDDVEDVEAPGPEGVGLPGSAHREQVGAEVPELGHAANGPGEVEDQCRGDLVVLRSDRAVGADESRDPGLAADRVEEPGLADPGLAGQEEELAASSGGLVETSFREVQEVVATHDDRTLERPVRAHERECTARRLRCIGHSTDVPFAVGRRGRTIVECSRATRSARRRKRSSTTISTAVFGPPR